MQDQSLLMDADDPGAAAEVLACLEKRQPWSGSANSTMAADGTGSCH